MLIIKIRSSHKNELSDVQFTKTMTGVINSVEMCSRKTQKINGTNFPPVIKMKSGVSCNLAPANYAQVIYSLLNAGRLICLASLTKWWTSAHTHTHIHTVTSVWDKCKHLWLHTHWSTDLTSSCWVLSLISLNLPSLIISFFICQWDIWHSNTPGFSMWKV